MAVFPGNKKNAEERKQPSEMALSMVAQGMTIVGDMVCQGDLRVEGRLVGNVVCKSKLVVGGEGVIEGNVDASNATIEGTIEGTVIVRSLLQLQESSKILGDIIAEKMVVQAGAIFTGTCKMGKEGQTKLRETPVPDLLTKIKPKQDKADISVAKPVSDSIKPQKETASLS